MLYICKKNNDALFCSRNNSSPLSLHTDVTTVTVSDVQSADDGVFSSVATAASIPEHVLVCVLFVLEQLKQTFSRLTFTGIRCSQCGDQFTLTSLKLSRVTFWIWLSHIRPVPLFIPGLARFRLPWVSVPNSQWLNVIALSGPMWAVFCGDVLKVVF